MNGQRPGRVILDELTDPVEVDPDEWCEDSRFVGLGTPGSADSPISAILRGRELRSIEGETFEVVIDGTPVLPRHEIDDRYRRELREAMDELFRRRRPVRWDHLAVTASAIYADVRAWIDDIFGRRSRPEWRQDRIVASGGLCAPIGALDYLDRGVDVFPHDYNPDGCWATHEAWDPEDPEAEACDRPAVDALGLCAKHRAEKVDG